MLILFLNGIITTILFQSTPERYFHASHGHDLSIEVSNSISYTINDDYSANIFMHGPVCVPSYPLMTPRDTIYIVISRLAIIIYTTLRKIVMFHLIEVMETRSDSVLEDRNINPFIAEFDIFR